MFDQLSSVIVPSLTKGRHNNTNNNTNNKAKCIPGGTLRVLAGKKIVGISQYAYFKYTIKKAKEANLGSDVIRNGTNRKMPFFQDGLRSRLNLSSRYE
jgi:hypothetical protein